MKKDNETEPKAETIPESIPRLTFAAGAVLQSGTTLRIYADGVAAGFAVVEPGRYASRMLALLTSASNTLAALKMLRDSDGWFEYAGTFAHEKDGKIYTAGDIITDAITRAETLRDVEAKAESAEPVVVKIDVRGGVAYAPENLPAGVRVEIVDHDNAEVGEGI